MVAPFGGSLPRAVGGYIRVSTSGQAEEGVSLDVQARTIRQYCAMRGWPEPVEYIDAGVSAYTDNVERRPAFRRLLADAEAGVVDVIVVVQLDRWARNLTVTLETLARLDRARCAFVSIAESLDFSTPIGKMALAMLGAIAQFQSDHKSEESKRVQDRLVADGRWVFTPPYGALLSDGRLTVDPVIAPTLERVLRGLATVGAQTIADQLTAEGVPPPGARRRGSKWGPVGGRWWPTTVYGIAENGLWLAQQPEPWPSLWIAARNAPQRAKARRDHATHMLTGLMRCAGCGGPVGQFPQQRDPQRRRRCRCLWRGRPGRPACDNALTWGEVYEAKVVAAIEALPPPRSDRPERGAVDAEALAALANERRVAGKLFDNRSIDEAEYDRRIEQIARRELALLPHGAGEALALEEWPATQSELRQWPPAAQNHALRSLGVTVVLGPGPTVRVVWGAVMRQEFGLPEFTIY